VNAERISAVWVYWAGGAEGDELRYSMRSVCQHFVDMQNVVLCGDVPEWFGGDAIESPRFGAVAGRRTFGSARFVKWIDSIVKLLRIVADPRVSDRFLWLYDDTIMLRDMTAAELATPRATGLLYPDTSLPASNNWREVVRRTAEDLNTAGLPGRNFSHHGPVVYDKAKLSQTIARFLPMFRPRVIESLYLNHWADPADIRPAAEWLQYTRRPGVDWRPRRSAAICNFGTFADSVERYVAARWPDPCAIELDGGVPATVPDAAPTWAPVPPVEIPPAF
jgi:hypothetical protein